MSTFVKKYPRARVSPHPTLNGWVIDLIMGPKGRPSRVKATYATIPFATKAAHIKLGIPTTPGEAPVLPSERAAADASKRKHSAASLTKDHGTCRSCNRPMRPAGTKAADFPGKVLRQREGLCQSCNYGKKKEQAA